ncbi:hypothetical protein [Nitrococcus mobilis]|uniref:Uncharacterized protein n=1 Tax=Nitrococcus mobilis Nb-231 TaxID=314278 RepID=A4BPP5_9GAMM|nr:hypothetical protein [Nitrococcus mobilis]EAR22546.1 hypothetical protein NB231_12439 [Nitrococcus mobilis Nb-231]
MALLAEEIVEEWLNRNGYFTIRGMKLGVHEIDLLAIGQTEDDAVECRHIEVQASMRPVSYISRVPKAAQRRGKAANSSKRTDEELREGVAEWVTTKYKHPRKLSLMEKLWRGNWSKELVINNVKSEDEVALIKGHGIRILRLVDVVSSLKKRGDFTAAGADFVDLIHMGESAQQGAAADAKKRRG